jgi:hypothetical protein
MRECAGITYEISVFLSIVPGYVPFLGPTLLRKWDDVLCYAITAIVPYITQRTVS